MATGREFFAIYGATKKTGTAVEIGSMDVNGTLKSACPDRFRYIGVDVAAGKNVDLVLPDPYALPFDSGSVDFVLASSVFEHAEMFWVLFLEALRILRSDGLLYLNVPSNGQFHQFPVDCWRFYPDSGNALLKWAQRNGFNPALLESFIDKQVRGEQWNDFVAVFLRDRSQLDCYPCRIATSSDERKQSVTNCILFEEAAMINPKEFTEDQEKLRAISLVLSGAAKLRIS